MNSFIIDGITYFAPNNMPIGDALQRGLVTGNVTQREINTLSAKTLKKVAKERMSK